MMSLMLQVLELRERVRRYKERSQGSDVKTEILTRPPSEDASSRYSSGSVTGSTCSSSVGVAPAVSSDLMVEDIGGSNESVYGGSQEERKFGSDTSLPTHNNGHTCKHLDLNLPPPIDNASPSKVSGKERVATPSSRGRVPTPELALHQEVDPSINRHHLDMTTPSKGTILTSSYPGNTSRACQEEDRVTKPTNIEQGKGLTLPLQKPRGHLHKKPPVARAAPSVAKATAPVTKRAASVTKATRAPVAKVHILPSKAVPGTSRATQTQAHSTPLEVPRLNIPRSKMSSPSLDPPTRTTCVTCGASSQPKTLPLSAVPSSVADCQICRSALHSSKSLPRYSLSPKNPTGTHSVSHTPKADHTPPFKDSDQFSVSSMSSCSIASDILERAKYRRDNFWHNS